tara:strand:- start:69 stop:1694 length:1626 start_codon:yes stop_codon:yes gene_type:complete
MAVSGIKGTGIGAVTQPYMGMGDESSGLTIGGEQPTMMPFGIDRIIGGTLDVLGGNIENLPPLTPPKSTGTFTAGDTPRTLFTGDGQFFDDELSMLESSLAKKRGIKTPQMTPEELESQQKDEQSGVDDSAEFVEPGDSNPTEDVIRSSVQDYLNIIGKETKATTTEEYIKEFADATGLDVSGKPDKSTALMTFGLALMQNKAGKKFDVGKMLGSVGEAGEKALPAFEKAKSEARALRAKAGEYALGRTREDEKIARQRGGYYIVPKAQGLEGRIKAFTEGSKRADLNAFELDALYENANFRQNFDIIPASEYNDVFKELTKKPEYGEMYASSYDNISLFNDAPEDLQIGVQRVNANYKGPNMPSRGYFNQGEYDVYAGRLNAMKAGLDKTGSKLAEAYSIVSAGEVTTPKQIGDAITSFGRAFGIKFSEGATDTDKVRRILNVISAERAPEILGEAGKTISDADRERVNRIVGQLGRVEDSERLKAALEDIYNTIVIGGYNDVNQGFSTLNMYANRPTTSRPTKLTKREGTESTFDATVE